jgi:hypothetical protein
MKKVYKFHEHEIVVAFPAHGGISCATCSLPEVIVQAVAFMEVNNVRQLVVDGAEIRYSHLTA